MAMQNQAGRRAGIKSSSYRWQPPRQRTRQAARPYVHASLVLNVSPAIAADVASPCTHSQGGGRNIWRHMADLPATILSPVA
jgi:hypothetical protein